LTTTVAQLNFIKWCIINGIIGYLKESLIKQMEGGQSLPGSPEPYIHNRIDTGCIPV
jgi:hypothetical protein